MKKKIIIASSILFCIAIGIIVKNNIIEVKFEEIEYKKIRNNLYYNEELIKTKARDKTVMLDCYQILSDFIKENYEYNVYIDNFNYSGVSDEIYVFGHQIIDGVIIENTLFSASVSTAEKKITPIYETIFENFIIDQSIIINQKNLMNIEEIKKIVSKLAKENKEKIVADKAMLADIIKGTIYLKYNEEYGIYYDAVFDNGSYIRIDAKRGFVIKSYYFNGIMT